MKKGWIGKLVYREGVLQPPTLDPVREAAKLVRLDQEAEILRLEKEAATKLGEVRAAKEKLALLDGRVAVEPDPLHRYSILVTRVFREIFFRKIMSYVHTKQKGGYVEVGEVEYVIDTANSFEIFDDPEVIAFLNEATFLPTVKELRSRGVRMTLGENADVHRLAVLVEEDRSDFAENDLVEGGLRASLRAYATLEVESGARRPEYVRIDRGEERGSVLKKKDSDRYVRENGGWELADYFDAKGIHRVRGLYEGDDLADLPLLPATRIEYCKDSGFDVNSATPMADEFRDPPNRRRL